RKLGLAAKTPDGLEHLDEHLLGEILGLVAPADEPEEQAEDAPLVLLDQVIERAFVSRAQPFDEARLDRVVAHSSVHPKVHGGFRTCTWEGTPVEGRQFPRTGADPVPHGPIPCWRITRSAARGVIRFPSLGTSRAFGSYAARVRRAAGCLARKSWLRRRRC